MPIVISKACQDMIQNIQSYFAIFKYGLSAVLLLRLRRKTGDMKPKCKFLVMKTSRMFVFRP